VILHTTIKKQTVEINEYNLNLHGVFFEVQVFLSHVCFWLKKSHLVASVDELPDSKILTMRHLRASLVDVNKPPPYTRHYGIDFTADERS
jgi:hypothetical protein